MKSNRSFQMKNNNFVPFTNVDLTDGFWKNRYELNRDVSVPNVQKRFEETARFDAMRFNYHKNGKEIHFFYDSDMAKWAEAVSYLIMKDPGGFAEYERFIDEIVDCMEAAQRPDGYLNSYHQQIEPRMIFKDRTRHELYCLGHLIEAAIAYDKATGKRKFLDVLERYCELIHKVFFIENSAAFETPGHEEIELALYKLYRYTGKKVYKEMADGFLTRRARNEKDDIVYKDQNGVPNKFGTQDDCVIEELSDANGHCVRALYLYSGIADMALENNDAKLKGALDSVFDDIVNRKMYITGGVGSTKTTESFTVPYDLPNMTAYAESCCAIAMIMFAMRLRRLEANGRYGDLIERVLYNSLLSSTSLDGKAFFYTNSLEIALEERNREVAVPDGYREWMPISTRVEVFWCSCCPANVNRMFASLADTVCFDGDKNAYIEQWIPSNVKSAFGDLILEGEYATSGKMTLKSSNYKSDTVAVRIPKWCRKLTVMQNGTGINDYKLENGYAYFVVGSSFELHFDFNIAPMFVAANPNVRANVGRVALTYGPTVYCLEGVDNGARLNQVSVSLDLAKATCTPDFHGLYSIATDGFRDTEQNELYFDASLSDKTPCRLKFIPYFAFANRGESDMLVWVRK